MEGGARPQAKSRMGIEAEGREGLGKVRPQAKIDRDGNRGVRPQAESRVRPWVGGWGMRPQTGVRRKIEAVDQNGKCRTY